MSAGPLSRKGLVPEVAAQIFSTLMNFLLHIYQHEAPCYPLYSIFFQGPECNNGVMPFSTET